MQHPEQPTRGNRSVPPATQSKSTPRSDRFDLAPQVARTTQTAPEQPQVNGIASPAARTTQAAPAQPQVNGVASPAARTTQAAPAQPQGDGLASPAARATQAAPAQPHRVDRNPPERVQPPSGLPRDAEWDAASRTWRCGAKDATGKLHGVQRTYRRDGSLHTEYGYLHGERTGRFRHFHPDGQLAREGELRAGEAIGEEVAYASSAATDEPLRACCVPRGSAKLVITHNQHSGPAQVFFDRQGRRLLRDGSLHPERPSSVEPDARYIPETKLWEHGRRRRGQRDGVWKCWSLEGRLREAAEYASDRYHGSRQIYEDDELIASWVYSHGVLHGSGFSRVAPDTYDDPRIVWQEGSFTEGVSSGRWRYLDARRQPCLEVELGPGLQRLPVDDRVFDVDLDRSRTSNADPARAALLQLRRIGAEARDDSTPTPHDQPAPRPVLTRNASMNWLKVSRNVSGGVDAVLAKLLEGLLRGAQPALMLREMACYLMQRPLAGLELITASLALEPAALEAQATRVLLLAEAGRPEAARRLLEELGSRGATELEPIRALLEVSFPRFEYWPADAAFDPTVAQQLPSQAAADTRRLQQAIAKAALRLSHVSQALRERLVTLGRDPEQPWLPPDVSRLIHQEQQLRTSSDHAGALGESALRLQSYTFEAEFEDETPGASSAVDTVVVNEALALDGHTFGELMRQARIEWTSLCWLCYSAGLTQIDMPHTTLSPPTFARALTTAFGRHHRLQDQIRTRGLRSRALGALSFEWEGIPIDILGSTLLKQAHDEYLEMRAMLYFAADETCRSPWQDDLRAC